MLDIFTEGFIIGGTIFSVAMVAIGSLASGLFKFKLFSKKPQVQS